MNRFALALATGLLLVVTACRPPDNPSRPGSIEELAKPLTPYVDPFIGTGGHGHVYPGAVVPWGLSV